MDPSGRIHPTRGAGPASRSEKPPPHPASSLAEKVDTVFLKVSSQESKKPSNPKSLLQNQLKETLKKEVDASMDGMLKSVSDNLLTNPSKMENTTKGDFVEFVDRIGKEGMVSKGPIKVDTIQKVDYENILESADNLLLIALRFDDEGIPYAKATDAKEPLTEEEEKQSAFINLKDNAVFCREEIREPLSQALLAGRFAIDESASEELKTLFGALELSEVTLVIFDNDDEDWKGLVANFLTQVLDFEKLAEMQKHSQPAQAKQEAQTAHEAESAEEISESSEAAQTAEEAEELPADREGKTLEEAIKNFFLENQLQRKIGEILQGKLIKWMESLKEDHKLALKDEEVRARLREFILHDAELRREVKRTVMRGLQKRLSIKQTRERVQILDKDTKSKLNIRQIHFRGEDSFYRFEVSKTMMGAGLTGKDITRLER